MKKLFPFSLLTAFMCAMTMYSVLDAIKNPTTFNAMFASTFVGIAVAILEGERKDQA